MNSVLRAAVPLFILAVGIAGYGVLTARRAVETRPAPSDAAPLVETSEVTAHGSGLDIDVEVRVVQRQDGHGIVRAKAGSSDAASHRISAGMRVVSSPLAVAEEGMALREQQP